ncbi:MAG: DUF2177 family protein [Candidatus Woesearchaeota archaeon]|nr:MAG: DUF2177 family protein [Candidatus Woesearchaeota archaeon]
MVSKIIKKYLFAASFLLILDLFWLLVLMFSFYTEQLSGFLRPDPVPVWSAAVAWFLIPVGIVFFVNNVATTLKENAWYGALYGLILYGVYDFTNYATLASWPLSLLVVDVLWGMFLCATASVFLYFIEQKYMS